MVLFFICNVAFTARLAVSEFKCHKPSLDSLPSNATDIAFDHLFDILLIIVELLHIPELIYLLIYLFRLTKDDEIWGKLPMRKEMKEFVGKKKIKSTFFTLVLGIFVLVALILPPICIYRSYEIDEEPTDEQCSEMLASVLVNLDHVYHGASFITNIIIVLVRYLMIYFTVMIGAIWKKNSPDVNSQNGQQPQEHQGEQLLFKNLKDVCKKHKDCLDQYQSTIENEVIPIYKIFRSFFVFQ